MNKKTTAAQAAFEAANPQTGEMQQIKYFEGSPKQYRFNGQNGRFNIDGITDAGTTLTLQPVAYRVFNDDLFARGRVDNWAEIFFVDAEGCLSSIMFNNSSVTELMDLVPRLFYAGQNLTDVVLNITAEKKATEKKGEKVTWYLAKFDFVAASAEAVAALAEFARQNPIYRKDTVTPAAEYVLASDSYAMDEVKLIAHNKDEAANETETITQAA